MPKPLNIIANDLKVLFESSFGGKGRSRLFISKEDMRTLADREILRGVTELAIMKKLYQNHNLVLVIVGNTGYGVIEEKKVRAWRTVPKRLL